MPKDRLFLLRPGFENPAYPGRSFYCWHCATIEGVLASFPIVIQNLDVERIDWAKPRVAVIDLVGRSNQSLPLLIIAKGDTSRHETGRYCDVGFVAKLDSILAALAERH